MSLSASRRTVWTITLGQALHGMCLVMVLTVAPLAGHMLAADKAFATVPHTAQWIATMLVAAPASLLMQRVGRRAGFVLGAVLVALGGAAGVTAMVSSSFAVLISASMLIGLGNGFAIYYRFAAAEAADELHRAKAIAIVIGAGVVSGLLAPEVSKFAKDLLLPYTFAGVYAAIIAFSLANLAVQSVIRQAPPPERTARDRGRPLTEIVRQPDYLIAMASATVGWGVMVLLMGATPLAMLACGHGFGETAFVIQWHVVGMFAPSFITGILIARLGVANVLLAGAIIQGTAVAVLLSGVEVWQFWLANMLQGIGWNFLFVGGTTLLTETYAPAERAKAQGFNDFVIFSVAALSSFFAGFLLANVSWHAVNLGVAPLIALVLAANFWLRMRSRAAETAPA